VSIDVEEDPNVRVKRFKRKRGLLCLECLALKIKAVQSFETLVTN